VVCDHKYSHEHLSSCMQTSRPIADGLALGRRLPINCNVLARTNTRSLKDSTLKQVLPYLDSGNLGYLESQVPNYLNAACLPYVQQYYSVENLDELRYSGRTNGYNEYEVYLSALRDEEERKNVRRFA
jgi:hypothetical protein